MTLTLDDVRNMKFHMTRRSGYEVQAVDQFIDQVEEAFAELTEENATLKQQVEALKAGAGEQPQQPAEAPEEGSPAENGQQHTEADTRTAAEPGTATATAGGERIVVTTSAEASQAAQRLVQMAEKVVGEAQQDAERIREEARREAHKITTDARTRAERSESEARVNADRVTAEAKTRSEQLDRDIATRRTEMFSQLESERNSLHESVSSLRKFESTYRSNLTAHLRGQIDALEKGVFEPDDKPEGLPEQAAADDETAGATQSAQSDDASADRPGSATPRLDALLGDKG